MSKSIKRNNTTLAMALFLLGIFMGALDSGIISPARGVIAGSLNISESASIWMVTIYTLTYAVSMPITGKLADSLGRKKIYIACIIIFTIGSLLCWLSDVFNNYNFLLISRVIQALGGGGIMPIATAYIGASFPPEKRGSALGFVGSIYGIATVIGPTLGTAILSLAGSNNWGYLFLINVPISLIILFLAFRLEENRNESKSKKMDILGAGVLSVLIASLMYALTNLQFHDFLTSIKSEHVWPFLAIALVSLPLFIAIEKNAKDPILNLKFFTNPQIVITLALSFLAGCGLMGTVFLPQFGENVLRLKSGTGGYIVTLFALFTGIGAPIGGKIIDRYGVKILLLFGFSFTILGSLYQSFVTAIYPNLANLTIGIGLMGVGMGFTMSTPINYLIMSLVKPSEISIGQSTASLFRSIGVAVSPNLLVNFISQASEKLPKAINDILPKITDIGNPMTFGETLPPEIISKFQVADSTSIYSTIKDLSNSILSKLQSAYVNDPNVNFSEIKTQYMMSLEQSKSVIENTYQLTLNKGYANLFIATAIIALIGFILSLFIKDRIKITK